MRRRQLLIGLSAIGVAGLVGGCDRRTRPLLAADTQTADHPAVRALQFFARRVEERTSGQVRTHVYSGGQLGGQGEALELTQFGGIDFVRVNLAPLNVFAPQTIVPVLPFLFRSTAHMRAAMDGEPGRQILASLRDHGLVGLCYFDSGARSFYTTSRLIEQPADLQGLKIRVQTSDIFVSMVEALGGDATPMNYGEVYQGMMQGVIDGAENNWPSYLSSRHYEVAPYFSETAHVMAPEVLAMSAHSWARLDESEQTVVQEVALESVGYMRTLWDAAVEEARTVLITKRGVKVATQIDHAAFVQRVEAVWDRYLVAPDMRRLTDDILSVREHA